MKYTKYLGTVKLELTRHCEEFHPLSVWISRSEPEISNTNARSGTCALNSDGGR